MRKRRPRAVEANLYAKVNEPIPVLLPELIMAARLSKRLGVSDVTLWRWRHAEGSGFPKGRRINRHVYFTWEADPIK